MRIRPCRLALAIAVVSASSALAQETRPCPAPDGAIPFACHADVAPVPMPGHKPPRYPSIFVEIGFAGEVRVRYVVDTAGRAVPGSFVVVSSSHALFTSAIKSAHREWRFHPAVRAGARVAVWYEEVFAFHATPGKPPGADDIVAVHDTTADGVPRTTLTPRGRDVLAADAYSAAELLSVQRSVLAEIAENVAPLQRAKQLHTLCVTILRDSVATPADSETLRLLSGPGRRAVVVADCPRTYASMALQVDSLGRVVTPGPPGWVNPHHLRVTRIDPWTRADLIVDVDQASGLGGHEYRCGARRGTGGWSVTCSIVRGRIS